MSRAIIGPAQRGIRHVLLSSASPYLLLVCRAAFAGVITGTGRSYPRLAEAIRVSEEGRRAISPEITVGPDGAINVIWLDKGLTADRPPPKPRKPGEHSHRSSTNLYFARSEDGGKTWSDPVRVNETEGEIWGFSVSKPRVAVGPTGTIHIFYPANDYSEEFDKQMVSARYRRSTDSGQSFSPAITINRPAGADREDVLGENLAATNSFGTMGVAPDGTIITAWQNTDDMQGHLDGADGVVAISTDDGKSFQPQDVVLPDNDICPCCQLTLAFDQDTAYMGVRKIYEDGRDSAVARSKDGGRSFSVDGRLDFGRWDIDGCPLKPTELAIAGDHVYAAAYTGGEDPPGLYFSVSKDSGSRFSGKRLVHPGASIADAPALTVDKAGNVRLVWHAKAGGEFRLYTATSTDQGKSLSPPAEVAAPTGKARNPATAVAADGTVYLTWEHDNEEVYVTALPAPSPVARR
jgi:hypothetical protein